MNNRIKGNKLTLKAIVLVLRSLLVNGHIIHSVIRTGTYY